MLFLEDSSGHKITFETTIEAQDYLEERHAKEGSFDWISEIIDDAGNRYGCSWKVAIEEI